MIDTKNVKYNEEIKNLDEIEELLDDYNDYVSIEPGGSEILLFIVGKIEEVEKNYNKGPSVKKIRYAVIKQNSKKKKEKYFYVGRRSARLINVKLREGHTLLKIERRGEGIDTIYIPTPVESHT